MLELSPELQAILVPFLTFLIVEGLKALSNLIKLDLSGAGSALSAGVVALVLVFINSLLALVPPEYHEVVRGFMAFLVVILSSFGIHKQFKRFESAKG